tara:strand:+ start:14570 stop:16474 length:1905 start_codon:yes stop_codon:yes gene_type:complete
VAIATVAAVGSRGSIALGDEVVYGVPVTPSHKMTFTNESLTVTENSQQSEEVRDDRAMDEVQRTTLDVSGDISCYIKASGHGILYRHALGDYVRLQRVDGSIRGRQERALLALTGGDDVSTSVLAPGNDGNQVIPLADESTVEFDQGGVFALVYRTANTETLVADDNAGAGFDYLGMATHSCVHVEAVDDGGGAGVVDGGMNSVVLTIGTVVNAAGENVNPSFDANGGLIKFGNRVALYYHAAALPQVGGEDQGIEVYLYNDGTNAIPGSTETYPAADDLVDIAATISTDSGYAAPDPRADRAGVWYMQMQATGWDDVWTHHMEAGRFLPVGLSIEVDRDAAIFRYTGCQINTMNLNFETGNIASSTFSIAGRREYSMSQLVSHVLPGATEVVIDATEAVAFADPADTGFAFHVITIGERTDIRYDTLTDNGDGTITLSGIPAAGDGSIDRFFKIGTNVDSRTQGRKTTDLREEALSGFVTEEIFVYQNGEYEEALQLSITFNNNLNLEKFFLGSPFRAAVVAQTRSVEGTIRYEFDDGKHYSRFLFQIFFVLEVRCISALEEGLIEGADPPVASSGTFFMPRCRYKGGTPNITSKDTYIEHDMPFDCLPDDALNTIEFITTFVNANQHDALDS